MRFERGLALEGLSVEGQNAKGPASLNQNPTPVPDNCIPVASDGKTQAYKAEALKP